MYDIHIRPTGPNGNRGKLILLFVYGSRFTTVVQVARRCASASMSANGIVGQSMRRLPSGYWVPFTVRAIRARRTTLLSGMRRMCPIYRTGSSPKFDTLLASWYPTYMQIFIISHSSCAEQYGDMSADTQTHK